MAIKSIGQFISALRKANGMTQKQLAERLNVSDKAVSRWERDESAPDLSLIPVIAEIFGVTSDEILRGERKNQADEDFTPQSNARVEKQIEHLINSTRTKFIICSIISIGISFVGLLAAMICNFGFNRAGLGFLIGCIFYIPAIICEILFVILTVNSIKTSGFEDEKLNEYKKVLFKTAFYTFAIILYLFCITIPFIENGTNFFGITFDYWLLRNLIYTILYAVIFFVGLTVANRVAVKKGFFTLNEKEQKNADEIFKLKKKSAILLVILIAVTFTLHFIFDGTPLYSAIWQAAASGREYTDLAEFKEYIETNEEPLDWTEYHFGYSAHHSEGVEETVTQASDNEDYIINEDGVYEDIYDEDYALNEETGDETTYDDYEIFTIDAPDGTVLCEYKHINRNVFHIDVKYDGDKVTVYTYTEADFSRADHVTGIINACIVSAYFIEALGVIIGYNVKKRKIVK